MLIEPEKGLVDSKLAKLASVYRAVVTDPYVIECSSLINPEQVHETVTSYLMRDPHNPFLDVVAISSMRHLTDNMCRLGLPKAKQILVEQPITTPPQSNHLPFFNAIKGPLHALGIKL